MHFSVPLISSQITLFALNYILVTRLLNANKKAKAPISNRACSEDRRLSFETETMVVHKNMDADQAASPDLQYNILPRENTTNSVFTPGPSISSQKPEKLKFGDKIRSMFSKNREPEKTTASRKSITVKDQAVLDVDDASYNSDSDKNHNKSKSDDYADIPDVEEENGLDSKSSSKMSKTEFNATASRISMGKPAIDFAYISSLALSQFTIFI